ncbi:MAG: hypothetical protein ABEK59_11345 [Halobacteria archaeon]
MTQSKQQNTESEEEPETDGGTAQDHTHYSEPRGVRYCFEMDSE